MRYLQRSLPLIGALACVASLTACRSDLRLECQVDEDCDAIEVCLFEVCAAADVTGDTGDVSLEDTSDANEADADASIDAADVDAADIDAASDVSELDTAELDVEVDACAEAIERCDGVDNDCDGLIDAADPSYQPDPCPAFGGVCGEQYYGCEVGVPTGCALSDYVDAATDAPYDADWERHCDGFDNDCDGVVDEDCCLDGPATMSDFPTLPDGVESIGDANFGDVLSLVRSDGWLRVIAFRSFGSGTSRLVERVYAPWSEFEQSSVTVSFSATDFRVARTNERARAFAIEGGELVYWDADETQSVSFEPIVDSPTGLITIEQAFVFGDDYIVIVSGVGPQVLRITEGNASVLDVDWVEAYPRAMSPDPSTPWILTRTELINLDPLSLDSTETALSSVAPTIAEANSSGAWILSQVELETYELFYFDASGDSNVVRRYGIFGGQRSFSFAALGIDVAVGLDVISYPDDWSTIATLTGITDATVSDTAFNLLVEARDGPTVARDVVDVGRQGYVVFRSHYRASGMDVLVAWPYSAERVAMCVSEPE